MNYSKQKVFFCTFGTNQYKKSLNRLRSQAESMGIYDDIIIYNENSFDKKFTNWLKNKAKKNSRGYAYWAWKSKVLIETLKVAKFGDIIHYADAGCHLNETGKEKLLLYLKKINLTNISMLVFSSIKPKKYIYECLKNYPQWLEKDWTKAEVFDFFGVEDDNSILKTPQIEATTFFIKKNKNSIKVIKKWHDVTLNNYHLCDDNLTLFNKSETFIEHRHDQSLFSIITKKWGNYFLISSYEYNYSFIKAKFLCIPYIKGINSIFPINAKRDRGDLFFSKIKKKFLRLYT